MKLRREQFKALTRKRVLLIDGAIGTLLQREGLEPGAPPDGFNVYNPDAVRAAHAAYVAAGADIILTNTFGATKRRLAPFRLASRADEINRAAVALAREAATDKAWVAGDVGPLGEYPEPLGALSFDEAYREFYRQARVLADAGVDLVVVETMSDLREAKAAVVAARAAFDGPIVAFMTFEDGGRAVTGTPPEVAAVTLVAAGADAVGANCSVGARELVPVIRAMAAAADVPVCAEPNAGLPRLVAGKTTFRQTPAQFASWVPKLVAAGAAVVGGCCGTTPEHVRLAAKAARGLTPPKRTRRERRSTLASRTRLVVVSCPPVVVGERINPTGRRELARELAKGSFDLVAREAEAQVNAGAAVVDVNVGDGDGAAAAMAAAVRAVQEAVDVPVSVDSARPEVLEAGLKAAVGKPLLNSCPASSRAMAKLLPLARRWGTAVAGLTMGARGIPATATARLKLAEKFVGRALDEGIALDDIYIDPLMLTAARGGAVETFETLREIKKNLGVRTIMGVSNVSHGLPGRDLLNAAAFLYAAGASLDLAIVNPLDDRMREAMGAASVLAGGEREVASYVETFSEKPSRRKKKKAKKTTPGEELYEAVLGGRRERAVAAAGRAVKNSPKPLAINDKFIVPALEKAGRLFERKEYYLPQVIRAAEAAQAAFGVAEKAADKKSRRPAGRVVFATVAGDVHDIGKNVVAAVLRSYGFDVYDLGKNVSASRVVESAAERRADVVALSALMTTTMPEMGKVAEALRARGVKARLLVGGAVVTEKYAREIGAAYARDAVAAARVAKRLVRR